MRQIPHVSTSDYLYSSLWWNKRSAHCQSGCVFPVRESRSIASGLVSKSLKAKLKVLKLESLGRKAILYTLLAIIDEKRRVLHYYMSLFNVHLCQIRNGSTNSKPCNYSKLLTKLGWTLPQFLSNRKSPEPWRKRRRVRRFVHREHNAPTVVNLSKVGKNNQQFCSINTNWYASLPSLDGCSMDMLKYTEHSCLPYSYIPMWKYQVKIACWSYFSIDISLWKWIHH